RPPPLQIRTRVMRRAAPHLTQSAPKVYIVNGNDLDLGRRKKAVALFS
ncbi:hypothetical protein A2U01_0067523, partial [Trifolium medium]|nr:hypothetical protein [Trifolium medium]